jgi:hypothetical protein
VQLDQGIFTVSIDLKNPANRPNDPITGHGVNGPGNGYTHKNLVADHHGAVG